MSDELKSAINRVKNNFKRYYRNVNFDDLEISEVPGYWREKEAKMHPGHPLHGCLFCEGPFKATYTYHDYGRDEKGRFSSPYKTWNIIKAGTAIK